MAAKPRPCWVCGQPTLVKDIAEERKKFPSGEREVMCKTCMSKKLEAAIAKKREEIGLP